MKTALHQVFTTYNSHSEVATVTSPKTGRVLRLDHRAMKYLTVAQRRALVGSAPSSWVRFTTQDLHDFLNAEASSRDEYKDGLWRDEVCISSEATDGECPHCEAKALSNLFG